MKLKNLIKRIPRPLQATICIVLSVVLAVSYYISIGCPTLTLEQEFRRAEKIHMVGPSTVVDTVSKSEYREFETMIVGETDHGICFFGKRENVTVGEDEPWEYHFLYTEKTGDITLAVPPGSYYSFWENFDTSLPIYVFSEDSSAVRAEIRINVTGRSSWTENGEEKELQIDKSFTETVDRTDPRFFRFTITSTDEHGHHALLAFAKVASSALFLTDNQKNAVITVTIRLFDASNDVITWKSLTMGPQEI